MYPCIGVKWIILYPHSAARANRSGHRSRGRRTCSHTAIYLFTAAVQYNYPPETKPVSIYPSIHLSIYPSIHLSIYPSIHLSIYPSVHLFIYSSIHLFIYSSIHLPFYLSIYRINDDLPKGPRSFASTVWQTTASSCTGRPLQLQYSTIIRLKPNQTYPNQTKPTKTNIRLPDQTMNKTVDSLKRN